jgi:hypothetical protein
MIFLKIIVTNVLIEKRCVEVALGNGVIDIRPSNDKVISHPGMDSRYVSAKSRCAVKKLANTLVLNFRRNKITFLTCFACNVHTAVIRPLLAESGIYSASVTQ